jgi:hypothetical protein
LADEARIRLSIDALSGAQILALLEKAYQAPKDIVAKAAKFGAAP